MTYEVLSSLPPEVDGSRTRLGRKGYKLVALRSMESGGVTFTGPSHPSVLPLIELVTLEGQRVAVYGYVACVTLRELVAVFRAQSRMVPLDLLARVLIDGAKALGAVTQGHWHNGISDGAISVGFDGITRVLDFGAPRSAGRFGTRSPLPGAPRDVFTLGAVAHSALTGFTGHYLGAAESLQLPSKVHPEATPALDDVVMTAISGALEVRQASVAQLATELEAVLGSIALDVNGVAALLKRLFRDRVTSLIRATSSPRDTMPTPVPQSAANPFSSVLEAEPATEMINAPPGMADEPPTYVGGSLQRRPNPVVPAPGSMFVDESTAVDRSLPPKARAPGFKGPEAATSLPRPASTPERIDLTTHPAVYSKNVLRFAGLVEPKPVQPERIALGTNPGHSPLEWPAESAEITGDVEASLNEFMADGGGPPKRIDQGTNPGVKPKDLSRAVDLPDPKAAVPGARATAPFDPFDPELGPGGAPTTAESTSPGVRPKDLPIIDEPKVRPAVVDEETKPLAPLGGSLEETSDRALRGLPGRNETNPGIAPRDFAKTLDELSPSVHFEGEPDEPPELPVLAEESTIRPTVPEALRPPFEQRDPSYERTQEQAISRRVAPTSDWELAQRPTEAGSEPDEPDEPDDGGTGSRVPLTLLIVAMTAAIIAIAFAVRHLFASDPISVPVPRHLLPAVTIDGGLASAASEGDEAGEDEDDDGGLGASGRSGEPRKAPKKKKKAR